MIDIQTLFSNDQAITVTAASTNLIDLGADSERVTNAASKPSLMFIQVTEAFSGGDEIYVTIQADDDSSFPDATTIATSDTLSAALLTANRYFRIENLPICPFRYLRLYYVVSGTMSSGAITAGLVIDRQTMPGLYLATPLILMTETGAKIVTDAGYEIQIG